MARPSKSEPLEEHYTPEEIAERLKFHVKTIHAWIRQGKFSKSRQMAHNAIRVPVSSVNKFLAERELTQQEDGA